MNKARRYEITELSFRVNELLSHIRQVIEEEELAQKRVIASPTSIWHRDSEMAVKKMKECCKCLNTAYQELSSI